MTKLILSLPLVIAVAFSMPAVGHAKPARPSKSEATADPAASKEDQQKLHDHMKMKDHIAKHVKYPATKQDLVKACKGMSDVKASDKKWFEETLADKTYDSAEDVERALGWAVPPADKAAGIQK